MCKKKRDLRTELEKKAKPIYFTMSDGVQVRVLEFDLAENPHEYSIFVIPGFATVFQSWEIVLELLTKEFKVYYFESREKNSSIIPDKKIERNITLHDMAHDIKEVIEQMKLDNQKYITLCSSTGGTIEIEALSEKWLRPTGAVMVGPTTQYDVKWIAAAFVTVVPVFVKALYTPFFRWYIGTVYVNKKKYPKQYAKYIRAGEEANQRKIRKLLWQMTKYECWDMVPKIDTPTLLIGATEDKMHASELTMKVQELLQNSEYVDLGTNINAHSQPLIDVMKNFIVKLEKKK
ncbi:MAG TPA: alpha/beta hydrolase [candidate division Zixibacteria bacterium]|nr:alpha/beta hydrolase [candidate division Zixibacteria bacterium]